MAVVVFCQACALVAGCGTESKRSVSIAGTASYDGFQAGEIKLTLGEDASARCEGLMGMGSRTPGDQIADATLSQPGPFTLQGTVCWTGSPPNLYLLARYIDGQSVACRAGAYLSIAPKNASDVSLILKDGACPVLK